MPLCFVLVLFSPRNVIKLESLSMQSFPRELILLRNLNSRVIHVLAWLVYCLPSCLLNSIPLFGWGMVRLKLLAGEDANKIVTFTCVWLSCWFIFSDRPNKHLGIWWWGPMLRLHFKLLLLSNVAGHNGNHLLPSSNGRASILTAPHRCQQVTLLIPKFQLLQRESNCSPLSF